MKRRVLALALAFAMLFTAGCGGSGSEGKTEPDAQKQEAQNNGQKDIFTMAIDYMPQTLRPLTTDDSFTTMIRPIFYPLYFTTGTGIEYYLADKVEVSEDKLTYNIHLNDKATWSDGVPITVDDILFTMKYQELRQGAVTFLNSVNGKKIEFNKIDDKSLEIVLPVPYSVYNNFLGGVVVMPSHAFDGDPSKVDDSDYFMKPGMATSGPFKVEQINADSIVYAARDDFFQGTPNVKKVVLRTLGAGSSKKVAFENGELCYMRVTTAQELDKYKGQPDKYSITSVTEARLNYLQLNPLGPVFSELGKDAREAIMIALNGQQIIDAAYGSNDLAVPANSILTPDQYEYNPDAPGYKQDLERAKALAESSGLKGKTLRYLYNADRVNMEAIATVVQQQLSQIGVNVKIEGLDSATFFGHLSGAMLGTGLETTFDLITNGWDSMRGSSFQAEMWLTSALNKVNAYGWSKEIGEKVLTANRTADEAEAKKLWFEIQEDFLGEYWEYPLTYTNFVMVSPKNVTGLDGSDVVPEIVDWMTVKVE